MLASDMIDIVRFKINDVDKQEFTDKELVYLINDAVYFLSIELIGLRDPEMIKTTTLTNGSTMPSDFHETCGKYPFTTSNGTVSIQDESLTSVSMRYYFLPARLENTYDTIPFTNNAYLTYLSNAIAEYALNRVELDLNQDLNMQNLIRQALGVTKNA